MSNYSRKQIIEELNNLDIHPVEKNDLLLVYLGEKPAISWYRDAVLRRPDFPDINRGRGPFDEVVAWAAKTGCAFETVEETINPHSLVLHGIEGQMLRDELTAKNKIAEAEALAADDRYSTDRLTLFFARDNEWLEKMKIAERNWDPQLYGECSGFPPTAIAAYINGTCVAPDRLSGPESEPFIVFAQYMVSPDHARQNLQTAKRWAEAVGAANPQLYLQMQDILLERQEKPPKKPEKKS